MILRKIKAIIASTIIISVNVSSNDFFYIVKQGDTLTGILAAQNLKPIYGKRGTLAKTLRLNPKISSTENKIFPMMKIVLVSSKLNDKITTTDNPINHETPFGVDRAPNAWTIDSPKKKPTPDRLPDDDFEQSFFWKLSPSISWKNLTSSDENIYRSSEVNAVSNTSYAMSAAYGMHFEDNFDVYSQLSLESVSFAQDSLINLLQKKFIAMRLGMGVTYQKKWQIEAAMSDEFFLTSPSLLNIEIKKATLPELKVTYLKDFYRYRNANLFYSVSASGFLPRSSPDVKSKLGFGTGGALEAKLHNQSFKIGYDLNLLKADGNSTKSQNIYWKFIWETL